MSDQTVYGINWALWQAFKQMYAGGATDRVGQHSGETPLDCKHEYKTYVGFTDTFDYCVHCDARKGAHAESTA